MNDNTLRARLDDDHWRMFRELCQTLDRDTPDMVRKLIRDAHAKMLAEQKQENPMINKDEIIDRVGGANWQDVVSEFSGQGESEVKATLDYMYPHEDNQELARAIAEKVNQ